MRKFILSVALVFASLNGCFAELVKNGNFSDDAAYWILAVPDLYGQPPEAQVADGEFMLKGLHPSTHGYLTLNQPVDIKQDKRYRITFEAKGEGDGRYLVTVQDPGEKAHVSKLLTAHTAWTAEAIEFTGLFNTDRKWVRDLLKATREARLQGGRTVNTTQHKVREPDRDDGPVCSWFTFAVGELSGSFSIRNLSMVELP